MNLADHLDDPETKRLCTELAKEEKDHIDSVSRMLLSLDMDEEDRPAL
jgi:rubrerythrin